MNSCRIICGSFSTSFSNSVMFCPQLISLVLLQSVRMFSAYNSIHFLDDSQGFSEKSDPLTVFLALFYF